MIQFSDCPECGKPGKFKLKCKHTCIDCGVSQIREIYHCKYCLPVLYTRKDLDTGEIYNIIGRPSWYFKSLWKCC